MIDEYRYRCDPTAICKDISAVSPWMADLRRATPAELRNALVRVRKRVAPATTSGHEDAPGQGSEVPSDGTSWLLMAAQFFGKGTRAEKVALEPVDRIRLSLASHMKYKFLLSNGALSMDEAWEYFCRVAKQADSPLARAVASEREYIRGAMRVLSTPYAPPGKGLAPPAIRSCGPLTCVTASC